MESAKERNRQFVSSAWGVGLLFVGILWLIPGDQDNIALLGMGLILLGLNLMRMISNIPISVFTAVLGILATGLGLFSILRPMFNILPFELQIIPLLVIAFGLYILIPDPKPGKAA